ncbi:MAG: polysulfide reductase NrfD [Candidatus Hydrogenedentes bacterium]|nr:polysulfide reductase NrfD [Candidatus Hydrogenedentota bacterium]MBI3118986.1 polysulfide reductase NrfD [Candidatus Hydrogenedentota bacterium]
MSANVVTVPPVLQEVAPIVASGHSYESISRAISDVVLEKPMPRQWYACFGAGVLMLSILLGSTAYLFWIGLGIWGIKVPVGWGIAIVNLVWWIGIGHAGTLISAILLIFNQDWRTAINRFAEAMTLFAVMCAGIFPILHLGRPWAVFFILPYPNTMALWPQFRSPLLWDVFAISTYFTVSLLFWYTGLLPDLATFRDRAPKGFARKIYGLFALGWRGSAKHWFRYEQAYILLGGMSAPLVVSVHTVVSFDFAVSVIPGWHTTIFPPYFVAGAIYSGFAMVLTIMIPARQWFYMKDFITERHLDNMAKVMLATGLVVVYGYFTEAFFAWYSGNEYERFMMWNRMTGPYWWAYTCLLLCNLVTPQFLWIKWFRITPVPLFVISIIVNIGMWLERFVIVITSLAHDYLPASWDLYVPTIWDWAAFVGSLGLFLTMMCLFIRYLPMISIFELRLQNHQVAQGEII